MSRESGIGNRNTEIGIRKSENGKRKTEYRNQKQKTENTLPLFVFLKYELDNRFPLPVSISDFRFPFSDFRFAGDVSCEGVEGLSVLQ